MTLLQIHVALSLVGMVSGIPVLAGLLAGRAPRAWTAVFLAATALTSVTGYPLPPFGFDPPRAVGTLSLILLAAAIAGFYIFRLQGAWRLIYVIGAVAAFYLNVFVGVAQAFGKIPALQALAPTQSEPPFLVAQLIVLGLFIVAGFAASRRFHPKAA